MIFWLLVIAFAVMVAGGWLVWLAHPWWCGEAHDDPVWVRDLARRQRCGRR